ncbi:MAG: hypothetical protein R2824_23250 [Saprospiraceae bacterium]
MKNFQDIQAELKERREEQDLAMREQYLAEQALQLKLKEVQGRNGSEQLPPTAEDQQTLDQLRSQITTKQAQASAIQAQTRQLEDEIDSLGSPQELINHLMDDVPVLLMPVRIQTRFVRVKHLLKGISRDHILDVSPLRSPEIDGYHASYGNWSAESPNCIATLHDLRESEDNLSRNFADEIEAALDDKILQPSSQEWIKKVPDHIELWIRIYPDDIFVHGHEPDLTPGEKVSGENFWIRWWQIHQANPNAFKVEAESTGNTGKPLLAAWMLLQSTYGHARAAWIFRQTTPVNFTGATTDYSVPPSWSDEVQLKSDVWTAPILSFVMPDHFVVRLQQGSEIRESAGNRIPYPLELVPAPGTGQEIPFTDHWRTNFEAAEKSGLAIRINFNEILFDPDVKIDSIIVLGVKATTDAGAGKVYLNRLFENHQYQTKGMAILPQGTPTNNFEKTRSGFSGTGPEPEAFFKTIAGPALFETAAHWKDKKDALYLTSALGVDPSTFHHLENGQLQDISAALAMNHLLWPATLGYFLEQFLHPTLSKEDLEKTRRFFLQFVTGRGLMPAFRVGHQPYGLLATTAFSHWTFSENDDHFIRGLYQKVLQPLDRHWQRLAGKVEQLTDSSLDLHKFSEAFIKIIGLNPSSEILYERPQLGYYLLKNAVLAAESQDPDYPFRESIPFYERPERINVPMESFYRFGLAADLLALDLPVHEQARIMEQHFSDLFRQSDYPFIDRLTPSEARKLPKLDGPASGLNYLEWLAQTPANRFQSTHFGAPMEDETFEKPKALLYRLARQALSRAYINTAIAMLPNQNQLISGIDFETENLDEGATRMEQWIYLYKHHHIDNPGDFIKDIDYQPNKWGYLDSIIKKDQQEKTIWEYITEELQKQVSSDVSIQPLSEIKTALNLLKDRSTASLHRLISEHLDLCNYRLDAWMTGMVNWRLNQLRQQKPESIYLGAYGYIENLRLDSAQLHSTFKMVSSPEVRKHATKPNPNSAIAPILHFQSFKDAGFDIEQVLADLILYLGDDPDVLLVKPKDRPGIIEGQAKVNPKNQGFFHVPSLEHAVAGALLRSGFLANNPEKYSDQFAIDLSPDRVRQSLYYLEGVKNGQELSALLGYQFERLLHDNQIAGDLDQYLLEFRKAFPMRADKVSESAEIDSAETKEAFYVVDGLKLLNNYRKSEQDIASFLAMKGIRINDPDLIQVKNVLDQLDCHMDAISDLMVAESIFQLAKGKLGKSSSILKMMNGDKEVEVPDIVRTPRRHKILNHTVAVQFDASRTDGAWPGRLSPRSVANPYLNHWLAEQFPDPGSITVNVTINGELRKLNITNIGLQPIDFLALFRGRAAFSETSELSHYLNRAAKIRFNVSSTDQIELLYNSKEGFSQNQHCLYDLKPLVDHLLRIIDNSRALLPADLELSAKSDTLDPKMFELVEINLLIDRFDDIINGRNYYSILNLLNLFHYHSGQLDRTDLTEGEIQEQLNLLQHYLFGTTLFSPTQESYFTEQQVELSERISLLIKVEHANKYFSNLLKNANSLLDLIRQTPTQRQNGKISAIIKPDF